MKYFIFLSKHSSQKSCKNIYTLSPILSMSGGDTLVPFHASHPMIPFTSHH